MSLIRGLLFGIAIAVLEVAVEHLRVAVGPFVLSDLALVVPFVLVPLALFWGWTWVSERWAGRSGPRLILFTVGLYGGMSLAGPLDVLVFAPSIDPNLVVENVPSLQRRLVFVTPAAIAAALYWLIGWRRLPLNKLTLAVGYVLAPSLALLSPAAAMGAVAGTAAGHAWRSPGARSGIAALVVVLMLAAAFGLPYVLIGSGLASPPARPLLP